MEARALSELVAVVLPRSWRFASKWHGDEHWRCVAATGLSLAEDVAGADRALAFCFGLLHDTRRENEHRDPEHGVRAARFAAELAAEGVLALGEAPLSTLATAMELHADGRTCSDPVVGVCWDADRLHLPRVGIDPDPDLLSTPTAREAGRLEAAAQVRRSPPSWDELVAAV